MTPHEWKLRLEWGLKNTALKLKKEDLERRIADISGDIYRIMHSDLMPSSGDPADVYGLRVIGIVLALEKKWGASFSQVFHYIEVMEPKLQRLEEELRAIEQELGKTGVAPMTAWVEHIDEKLHDL